MHGMGDFGCSDCEFVGALGQRFKDLRYHFWEDYPSFSSLFMSVV